MDPPLACTILRIIPSSVRTLNDFFARGVLSTIICRQFRCPSMPRTALKYVPEVKDQLHIALQLYTFTGYNDFINKIRKKKKCRQLIQIYCEIIQLPTAPFA